MANDSGVVPGSVSSDTNLETTNKVMANNAVSSPLNILETGVGEHGRMGCAMDPTLVGSSSLARNVSPTLPSVVGRPLITTQILNNQNASREIVPKTSNRVKVTMDDIAIGRSVDLSAYHSYEELTKTLDAMFRAYGLNTEGVGSSYLLSGQSEYVLTFEDEEGDLMFAGDYLWPDFQKEVKKIRITKNPEYLRLGYRERTAEPVASEESRTT